MRPKMFFGRWPETSQKATRQEEACRKRIYEGKLTFSRSLWLACNRHAWASRRARPSFIHSRLAKQAKQFGVDFLRSNAIVKNPQRAISRDGTLVGSIRCRQRVKNIAYRHHFGRQRNLIA